VAEGGQERIGTVTLDARDGRGDVRDAPVEVAFESLRL
jgi:hypothetical protein